jgi:hypothetical protein
VSATIDDVARLCRRLNLSLVELLSSGRPGGSLFVVRVRDAACTELVLKQPSVETGTQELATLRAWSGTGITPRLIAEPEPGLYLAEWFEAVPLHEAPEPASHAIGVGRALRILHEWADPPSECFDTRAEFSPASNVGWGNLTESLRKLRLRLAEDLIRRHPVADVLLHGDLVPLNVLVTRAGPRVIDPVGRRGLAAWDLAQLAVAAAGRGIARLLPALIEGYGCRPLLIDEVASWMVLRHLDKNLSNPQSPHTRYLQPLADALLKLDDPASFAASHLS